MSWYNLQGPTCVTHITRVKMEERAKAMAQIRLVIVYQATWDHNVNVSNQFYAFHMKDNDLSVWRGFF